jgi:small conductance mechanosensitive channel
MNEHLQAVEQIQKQAIDLAVNFGPRLFVAVLILAAGVVVGRWVGRAMERGLGKLELEPPVRHLIARVVRVLVVGLFLVMALQNLGVELLPLIAGLGIAGAGVALALQGVLGNLAAGLTIIFTRPFRVGEYVSIVGVEGRIETIGLFNTTLSHPDRSRIVVPNRKIVGEILHNYGSIRQLHISVGVAYDTDLSRAVEVIRALLQSNPRVLEDPAPSVDVALLGESAINIHVEPWTTVADYAAATGEIQKGIVEAFRQRGIAIPFARREIRSFDTAA